MSRYLASLKAVLAPGKGEDGQEGGGSGESANVVMAVNKEIKDSNIKKERDFEETLDELSSEQIEANRRQFERTDQLVRQFMLNEGPQLQRDLKEYANKCQNWVSIRV